MKLTTTTDAVQLVKELAEQRIAEEAAEVLAAKLRRQAAVDAVDALWKPLTDVIQAIQESYPEVRLCIYQQCHYWPPNTYFGKMTDDRRNRVIFTLVSTKGEFRILKSELGGCAGQGNPTATSATVEGLLPALVAILAAIVADKSNQ